MRVYDFLLFAPVFDISYNFKENAILTKRLSRLCYTIVAGRKDAILCHGCQHALV